MKINWIEYKNLETGLEIEKIYFGNLTLLVGASGAGKTQILKSLVRTCELAIGNMEEAVCSKSTLNFSIDTEEYEWSYTIYAERQNIASDKKSRDFKFQYEKLVCNNEILFERDDNGKIFVKQFDSIPKPKQDESLISQYKDDLAFKHIYQQLNYLFQSELELDIFGRLSIESYTQVKKELSMNQILIKAIEPFYLNPFAKFGIIKLFDKELSQKIVDAYINIFNDVQDVDYLECNYSSEYCLTIKIDGTWIQQNNISSGMLKTFCHIVNIMTFRSGSVVLIDEFENGLGINCINVVSDLIMHERNDLQFIITSHHPYIINSIGMENWSIISRKSNKIATHTAEQLNLGISHHDAYIQLMNLLQDGVL